MTEVFHYDKLLTLNKVYQHTLIQSNSEFAHEKIRTPLYPHQTTMVHGMKAHRERMTRGFVTGQTVIQGKLGIVGEPSGSGKTLTTLSYLMSTTHFPVTSELTTNSTKYFFSHEMKQETPGPHLVIVPHTLFGQWKEEIEKHTSIGCVYVEMKRVLKQKDLDAQIRGSPLVLTTNKCYPLLQQFATEHQIRWDNVVVDEATSIFFRASDPPLSFQFLWLLAPDWISLLYPHPHVSKSTLFFLKDRVTIHPDLEHWLMEDITQPYEGTLASSFLKEYLSFSHPYRNHMVLRTGTEFRISSMKLPPLAHDIIPCKSNLTLNSLTSFYVSRNREPAIRPVHVPQLFEALGIPSMTSTDYLQAHPTKASLIQRKVKDKECGICLEPCEHPTMVTCCHHLYCGSCLLKNMLIRRTCPTCREVLDVSNMCCFAAWNHPILRAKPDVLLELLRTNPKGIFMIYSPFTAIFYELVEQIQAMGIKAERMENNLFSLRRTMRNLHDGTTTVLFVSQPIRGLSLPSITHLIFYHEPSSYEWKEQLLHSSQRMGRTLPLTVLHLNSEIPV